MTSIVRPDLAEAHAASLAHIASPGCCFTGAERLRIAEIAREAFLERDPSPPWVKPFEKPEHNVAYRLARHAGTLTEGWYRALLAEGLTELEWVEVVGIVVAVIPVVAFARAAGVSPPADCSPGDAVPTGARAPELVSAELNWVPVAAPADQQAAVLQALSALPTEWSNLWQLAAAQYMTSDQMADPAWNRGTLSRPQMELVAGRISKLRECFY